MFSLNQSLIDLDNFDPPAYTDVESLDLAAIIDPEELFKVKQVVITNTKGKLKLTKVINI
jgi:hypothetical protein